MHRTLVSSIAATVVLVGAATAVAQTPTTTPPQRLTAGHPLPDSAQSFMQHLSGKALKTVPRGWTILSWDLSLDAGASTVLDLACPDGSAITDLEMAPTNGPLTILLTPNDYVPFYGSQGSTVTAAASTGVPGTMQLSVTCAPLLKARTTIAHGRSPVTFPNSEPGIGLKKGAVIPHTWRLYKSVIRKAGASGGVTRIVGKCPGDTQHNQHAISRPGHAGMTLPSNGFTLGPSAALAKGPVTVYTLCSSLNV
jgi:hypothetical protein